MDEEVTTEANEREGRPPSRHRGFVLGVVAGIILTVVLFGLALLLGAIFFVERRAPAEPYPPRVVAHFMRVCAETGASPEQCECSIGELQETVALEELAAAGAKEDGALRRLQVHFRDVQDECA